ncbi:MAG: TetR/AcrR family transcriptional regulator [Methanobacterium sp.]
MTGNKDNLTVKIEKNTKERIFDAAIQLFAQYGFEGTSMREIAEEVGIKKASMYSHFKSKDEILDKIMDYPTTRIGMVGPQGIETEELIVSMGVENFMKMAISVVTDWMKDPYMEKIWRIICIELYHNQQIKDFYSKFTDNALSFWKSNFEIMMKHKLIKPSDPEILAIEYLSFYGNAYMDYFILRYGETSGSFLEEYQKGIRKHTEFIVNAIKS